MGLDFDEEDKGPVVVGDAPARLRAVDKKIINGDSDVNQLVPFKYKWAWGNYLHATENHWMPAEIDLRNEAAAWPGMTDGNKQLLARYVRHLTAIQATDTSNYIIGAYRAITAPEVRQYYLRQAFERAVHAQCAIQLVSVIPDIANVSVVEYDTSLDPLKPWRDVLTANHLDTTSTAEAGRFLIALAAVFIIPDNVQSIPAVLGARKLALECGLPGIKEQLAKIQKDRNLHFQTTVLIFREIIAENQILWTRETIDQLEKLFDDVGFEVSKEITALYAGYPEENTWQSQLTQILSNIRRQLGLSYLQFNAQLPAWYTGDQEVSPAVAKPVAATGQSLEW